MNIIRVSINMEEKTQMIAVPQSLHAKLKELKRDNKEPLYSVISRLMDNMPKIAKEVPQNQSDA